MIAGVLLLGGLMAFGTFLQEMQKNQALAVAKMLTMANPDVEVISQDLGSNAVTFFNKKTGQTVTMNFDEISHGRIDFRGTKSEPTTIDAHGDGQSGTLEVNAPDGSMRFGAGAAAKMPDWVPAYPETSPEGIFSMQGAQGNAIAFKFTAKAPPQAVISFYEQLFKQAGFKITSNVLARVFVFNGGMISAEGAESKRTCMVMLGNEENGATSASIVFSTKP